MVTVAPSTKPVVAASRSTPVIVAVRGNASSSHATWTTTAPPGVVVTGAAGAGASGAAGAGGAAGPGGSVDDAGAALAAGAAPAAGAAGTAAAAGAEDCAAPAAGTVATQSP